MRFFALTLKDNLPGKNIAEDDLVSFYEDRNKRFYSKEKRPSKKTGTKRRQLFSCPVIIDRDEGPYERLINFRKGLKRDPRTILIKEQRENEEIIVFFEGVKVLSIESDWGIFFEGIWYIKDGHFYKILFKSLLDRQYSPSETCPICEVDVNYEYWVENNSGDIWHRNNSYFFKNEKPIVKIAIKEEGKITKVYQSNRFFFVLCQEWLSIVDMIGMKTQRLLLPAQSLTWASSFELSPNLFLLVMLEHSEKVKLVLTNLQQLSVVTTLILPPGYVLARKLGYLEEEVVLRLEQVIT